MSQALLRHFIFDPNHNPLVEVLLSHLQQLLFNLCLSLVGKFLSVPLVYIQNATFFPT